MKCSYSFYSDKGGRNNNEDSFFAGEISNKLLFVVADGLGGHECGEVASKTAIEAVQKYTMEHYNDFNAIQAVACANQEVRQLQRRTGKEMKTTITVVFVDYEKTTMAHVGDTRIYAFGKNCIAFQSLDHSASQLAVNVGEINSSQIRHHSDRNILLRALGVDDNVKVDVTQIDNNSYMALLLCTDGFWEYVTEPEMLKTLSHSRGAKGWLKKMKKQRDASAPANSDNNTAIAVMK